MADKSLVVLLSGQRLGTLTEDHAGRHWFTYDPNGPDQSLSLSMPRRMEPWGPEKVEPFIDGLLPDNTAARNEIARRFGGKSGNPFTLLAAVGRDCAGAVQFLEPGSEDRLDDGDLTPLSEEEIGDRLQRMITSRTPSWQVHGEHWSLAGAQEKFALHRQGDQWYQASGATPTTHIIKPGVAGLHSQAYNEALCLTAVRELGLPTAETEFIDFAGVPAVVSKRWDRYTSTSGAVIRVHQEDLCQALAVPPANKYQSDGGPSAGRIITLLRALRLEDDIGVFTRALVVNFLLGATDAHAKNYALLLPADAPPRLAPLYDIASIYPYSPSPRTRKLAMKIGSRYAYDEIEHRHWKAFAETNELDVNLVMAQLYLDATELPDALRAAVELHPPRTKDEDRLATSLITETESQCRRVLAWFG